MGELHYKTRKTFIIQYANSDFLEKFRSRIIQSIIDNNFKIQNINNQEIVEFVNKFNKIEQIVIPKTPIIKDFDINST